MIAHEDDEYVVVRLKGQASVYSSSGDATCSLGVLGKRLISCPGLWEKVVLPGTAGVSEVNPPTRGRFTAME
ncbi:unnamed protein product [Arctogadus glacialis]